jgi:inner membrane protein
VDNLTHTFTGVLLARAGLNRVVPRGTLLLALAANAPDVDVVSWFGGSLTYLRYHRGWTHTWLLVPVMALLPALIVVLVQRRWTGFARLWIVALVGVISHLLLDWTNIYGIRMLMPFSSDWLRLDAVNVIDICIWALLFLGLAAPFLSGLVSSEIGAKKSSGRGWARLVLVLLVGYEFGRLLAHERAVATLDSRVYQGAAPRRVAAFPGGTSPLKWRGLVETESSFVLFDLDLLSGFDPAQGRTFYKPPMTPAMEAAKRTGPFRVFLYFSPYTLWRSEPSPGPSDNTLVEAFDLRFGEPAQPGFLASALIGPNLQVQSSNFEFGRIRPR